MSHGVGHMTHPMSHDQNPSGSECKPRSIPLLAAFSGLRLPGLLLYFQGQYLHGATSSADDKCLFGIITLDCRSGVGLLSGDEDTGRDNGLERLPESVCV